MDDIRTHLIPVLVNIIHVKVFGNGTVELDSNHGIFLAVHVLCLNIDLGAIKSRFAVRLRKGNAVVHKDFPDLALGRLPILLIPQILLPVIGIPLGKAIGHLILEP